MTQLFNIGSFAVAANSTLNSVSLTIFSVGIHHHLFDIESTCVFRFGVVMTIFDMQIFIGKVTQRKK